MKNNISSLLGILIGATLCSFTHHIYATGYWVNQNGVNHGTKSKGDFVFQATCPGDIPGSTVVAWFIGYAADATSPTDAEFNNDFEAIDGDYGGTDNNSLDDETNESTPNFEKQGVD